MVRGRGDESPAGPMQQAYGAADRHTHVNELVSALDQTLQQMERPSESLRHFAWEHAW